MALETLKGVEEIGGFRVNQFYEDETIKAVRWNEYIEIDHEVNTIKFTIQNGPIKENGVNGCQVDTLIHAAKHIIFELEDRKADREKRGVEGLNKK